MKYDEKALDRLVRFRRGLVPVVVQNSDGTVLMLAYMNRKAMALSLSSGFMHYWSRSRRRIWMKGELSGHRQRILEARVNCEKDSMLFVVEQVGGCCHMGYGTCFYRAIRGKILKVVEEKIFEPSLVYSSRQKSIS